MQVVNYETLNNDHKLITTNYTVVAFQPNKYYILEVWSRRRMHGFPVEIVVFHQQVTSVSVSVSVSVSMVDVEKDV